MMGFADRLICWLLDWKIVSKEKFIDLVNKADTDQDGWISVQEIVYIIRGLKK